MKGKKLCKLLAVLLVLAIAVGLAVSCGKGGKLPSDTGGQTPQGDTKPGNTNEAIEDKKYEKKFTITIGGNPVTGVPFEERYWVKEINERFNIDFQLEDVSGEKGMLALNSGELPDLMPLWLLHQLMFENLITDLTPYINEQTTPNIVQMMDKYGVQKYRIMTTDGRILSFPMIITHNLVLFGWTFNKTLLDEAGITELPDDFDALYDLGMRWKAQNPEPEKYAFGGDVVNQIIKGFTLESNFERDKDKFVLGYLKPVAKDAIVWLANAYKNQLIHPEYLTMTTQKADILNRNCVGWVDRYIAGAYDMGPGGNLGDPNFTDETVGILPPKNPNGQRSIEGITANITGIGFVVNKKTSSEKEKFERLLALMDWVYSEEGITVMEWGEEGISYFVKQDGTKDYTEDYMYSKRNPGAVDAKFDWQYYQNWTEIVFDNWMAGLSDGMLDVQNTLKQLSEDEFPRTYNEPPFSYPTEVNAQLMSIGTVIGDYAQSEIHAMIMGKKSVEDNWDTFIQELKKKGADEFDRLRNDEYQKWKDTDAGKAYMEWTKSNN